MSLTEILRTDGLEAFDQPAVTNTIESLTAEQVAELADDRDFTDRLRDDLLKLQDDLKIGLVDRDELIEIALACFIAHLPMIALGPPGTAKSLVFRQISRGLGLQETKLSAEDMGRAMSELRAKIGRGAEVPSGLLSHRRYFEYLVTRFTTPDELLGPADINLMIKASTFFRQTGGLLPEAHVAFLDEIFKANSAILNALLSIVNERIYYNAGRPVKVPLCMVFGASNEPPQEEELWALFDRFPVRVLCSAVEDTHENLENLLEKALTHARRDLMGGDGGNGVKQLATVNHFRMLHRIIHAKYGGERASRGESGREFLSNYENTFKALKREFQISDRTYFKLYRLVRALAFFRGDSTLKAQHLVVFKYCYRDPESAPALAEAVRERIRRYT